MVKRIEFMRKIICWECKYCHLRFEDSEEAENHEFECAELTENERQGIPDR